MFIPENTPDRIKVYEQKNAIQKNQKIGNYYISQNKFNDMRGFIVEPGDIIVSCAGTIGEIFVMPSDSEIGIINQALMRIRLYLKSIQDYFILYFDSVLKKEANDKGKGTAIKNIPPFDILKKMLFPLPPENEIKRLVNKVNQLTRITTDISYLFLDVKKINLTIKSKILDLYFGENSSYKSYYGKRLTTTLKELIPLNLIGDGDWVLSENMDSNGEFRLIQLKHISNGNYLDKPYQCVNKDFFEKHSCSEIKENYLLINRLIADSMSVCIVPKLPFRTITAVDVCWIAPSPNIYNQEYLMYYLMSPGFQSQLLLKCGGTTRKRISKSNLINIPLHIHNIKYQEIIGKRIKDMFLILDNIAK